VDSYIERTPDSPEISKIVGEESGLSEEQNLQAQFEREKAEEERKEKNKIRGTKYEYVVVFDPISWVPECVLRKFSMEYPLIVQRAVKEMEQRKKI
jgi:hypothetical protein